MDTRRTTQVRVPEWFFAGGRKCRDSGILAGSTCCSLRVFDWSEEVDAHETVIRSFSLAPLTSFIISNWLLIIHGRRGKM